MLALVDAAEACFWLQGVVNEILGTSSYNIGCLLTANHSSVQSIQQASTCGCGYNK